MPKPGGTLRIAGVARTLNLDPASPASETVTSAGLDAVSEADGNRLVSRMVLRQLYGYEPYEAPATSGVAGTDSKEAAADGKGSAATTTTLLGPVPDLASGQPKVSKDGLTATIKLRAASWDVPSARRVTSTDELRALKRLCLPTIHSPVSGYLAESVVGYATACAGLARNPPRTIAALDAVTIPGLAIEGDTTLIVKLIRPTNDLTAILSLPETSPLPVESFTGIQVTNDPLSFVGDGPYRFIQAQSGETYALSRSPSWDPASDPLRHAYVDHISIRGGLTAAKVLALVRTGGADLSLDVPATPAFAAGASDTGLVVTPARSDVLLAVGLQGPAAARLKVTGVRRVLAACIDTATRTRVTTALGSALATPADELLAGLALDPTGRRELTLSPSAGASASSSASATASPTPSASPTATPTPAARCARVYGVTGTTLSMLTLDSAQTRAAAAVVAARLAVAGVHVTIHVATAGQYALLARRGGWDLLITVRELRYPDPRALLAPLLDPSWLGADQLAPALSRTYTTELLRAVAETGANASLSAWNALSSRLEQAAVLIPLAQLNGVYPRGPNVAHAPTVATFSNADPTNVALGSTLPGDTSESQSPTP